MEETRSTARKPRAIAAPGPAAGKKAPAPGTGARKAPVKKAPAAGALPAGREDMVRTAAYFLAERRGFVPGHEWEDWLAAEAEVTALVGTPRASKGRKAPARKPPRQG